MTQLDREAFLAALLTGELSLDHPQVQERLRAEPELLTMLEELRNVEAAVARAAGEQREVLDAARSSEDTALADRVTAGVQQAVAERRRTGRQRWLAAAAALLGLMLGWYFLVRTPPVPDIPLGGDERLLHPKGDVERYSPFTWKVDTPRGSRLALRIYPLVGGISPDLSKRLPFPSPTENVASPWHLSPEQESALPDEIYWELEVIGGDVPEVLHARARRR